MSQHDYNIADSDGATVRADINDVLAAIVSWNSGATAPATTFARMRWADTTAGVVKRRNAANSAWIVESTDDETRVLARSSNTMLDVSDIGKTVRATSTFTQTFDACATLGDGWFVDYINDGSGTITFDPNSTETINGQTTLAFAPGESGRILCNGTNLRVINRSRYAGAVGAGRNITARQASNSTIDIDADELQLKNAAGECFTALSVNLTVDITASGANGLDTGAEASGTWYYGWVIAKEDGTVAGLLSTSASAPTMPSGYTYKALVTAVRNNGSSNFIAYQQNGKRVFFDVRQSALSGGTSSGTSFSVATLVPAIAHAVLVHVRAFLSPGVAASRYQLSFGHNSSTDVINLGVAQDGSSATIYNDAQVTVPNLLQTLYYGWSLVSGGGGTVSGDVWVNGFELPMGGE